MAGREVLITAELHTQFGVITRRNNMRLTHPIMSVAPGAHPDRPYLHAERAVLAAWIREFAKKHDMSYKRALDTIRRYEEFGRACHMKVFRYGLNHEPQLAKPCAGCEAFIRSMHIGHVYFTKADTHSMGMLL